MTDLEQILTKMDDGFQGVHIRIDKFKDEFHGHQLACKDLFAQIAVDAAARKGTEAAIAKSLVDRINWAKVRTGVAITIGGLLSWAAIKILLTNFGKFTLG